MIKESIKTKEEFEALVEEIGVAMMTTRTAEGHLRSRAMATQKKAPGCRSVVCDGGGCNGVEGHCE